MSAQNFLPFGPEGISFKFSDYGNIVLIQGENQDAKPIESSSEEEFKTSSNGSGKSSIFEILVYGLYGKTIKRPEKLNVNDVVHNKIGKDCKVVVEFDKYRIVRIRSTNSSKLRMWESEEGTWDDSTEITLGDSRLTQKRIIDAIGLSYDAFLNICIFTDDQRNSFLECTPSIKTEIVEDLMSLGNYRQKYEQTDKDIKQIKQEISTKSNEYTILLRNQDESKSRIELTKSKIKKWHEEKKVELQLIENKISQKKNSLKETDDGLAILEYQKAQSRIEEINEKLPKLEKAQSDFIEKYNGITKVNDQQKEKLQTLLNEQRELSFSIKTLQNEKDTKNKEIKSLKSKSVDVKCDTCKGVVKQENIEAYCSNLEIEIGKTDIEINAILPNQSTLNASIKELQEKQDKNKQIIEQANLKLREYEKQLKILREDFAKNSKVEKPVINDDKELLLKQEIDQLEQQSLDKKKEIEGPSPFQEFLDDNVNNLEKATTSVLSKEKEIKELEESLPYYHYWLSAFGPKGIRKWVIDGIIPDLNSRINYWLQFLIDNTVTLTFDNELKETIQRNPPDGDPYVYYAMSTGQKRRLNLAVSQAFAHIAELSSGSSPSFVFFDEISTNIDFNGIVSIFNMICELSQNKQVFVTTHSPELTNMLESYSQINLVHKDGFTTIRK
jgi:DNA repair exonuclease SbcCD ATPase subunit